MLIEVLKVGRTFWSQGTEKYVCYIQYIIVSRYVITEYTTYKKGTDQIMKLIVFNNNYYY